METTCQKSIIVTKQSKSLFQSIIIKLLKETLSETPYSTHTHIHQRIESMTIMMKSTIQVLILQLLVHCALNGVLVRSEIEHDTSSSIDSINLPKGTSYRSRNRLRRRGVQSVEHAKMVSTQSSPSPPLENRSRSTQSLDNLHEYILDHYHYSFETRKHYGGKKKGKKGKKGKKKRYTAAPSTSPQPSVSTQPSAQPSVSTMPSSKPSQSPSDKPSQYPSLDPTSTPSLSPSLQPSSSPSSNPTSKPSQYPSLAPTSIPSLQPTSIPSSQPSNEPTSQPSTTPSSQPSTSAQPSLSPSISQSPSNDRMRIDEPIYGSNNQIIGTKSGCTSPTQINPARFAERSLTGVQVRFQYLLQMVEGSDVRDVLGNVDDALGNFVFEGYIECQDDRSLSVRRLSYSSSYSSYSKTEKVRDLQSVYDPDQPMGVSTLPMETQDPDLQCSNRKTRNNADCIVVDGGISIFFERDADVNPALKKYELLLFLRDSMDSKSFQVEDTRVLGMDFVQAYDLEFDRGESIVGVSGLNRSDDYIKSDGPVISVTGSLFIASALLVILGAMVAFVKRKRINGYSQKNPAMLEALDKEYEGDFNDDDQDQNTFPFEDFSPQRNSYAGHRDGMNFPVTLVETKQGTKIYSSFFDDDEKTTSSQRSKKRRMRSYSPTSTNDDDCVFPVQLSETRDGYRYPVSRNMTQPKSIDREAQDVHYCTSANCAICQRNAKDKIRFIPSSEFMQEIEIVDVDGSDRISDKTLDFSKPYMNDRYYNNQDTVHL